MMEQERTNRTVWIVIGVLIGALFICCVSGLIGGAIGYAIGVNTQRPCDRYDDWEHRHWQDDDDWAPQMPAIPDVPEMPDWPESPARPDRVQPYTQRYGALIVEVAPNSPAEDAGLEPGDTILAVDGQPLPEEGDLKALLQLYRAGDYVELMVSRADEQAWYGVELGRQPDTPGDAPYLGIVYRVMPLGVRRDDFD